MASGFNIGLIILSMISLAGVFIIGCTPYLSGYTMKVDIPTIMAKFGSLQSMMPGAGDSDMGGDPSRVKRSYNVPDLSSLSSLQGGGLGPEAMGMQVMY